MFFIFLQIVTSFFNRFFYLSSLNDNPDKETTICVVPFCNRITNVGSIVHILENKGFKLVGLKLLNISPLSVPFMANSLVSQNMVLPTVSLPVALIAIQGKDAVAMVKTYLHCSGPLITRIQSGPIIFYPSTVAEANVALEQLFGLNGLCEWQRSTDWWTLRENC